MGDKVVELLFMLYDTGTHVLLRIRYCAVRALQQSNSYSPLFYKFR